MSASLVGSEMCIRDRPDCARPSVVHLRRPLGTSKPGSWSPLAAEERSSSCLLYTSDAADDM
eukprot:12149091-Alexandrium_andersonii.AAC.1